MEKWKILSWRMTPLPFKPDHPHLVTTVTMPPTAGRRRVSRVQSKATRAPTRCFPSVALPLFISALSIRLGLAWPVRNVIRKSLIGPWRVPMEMTTASWSMLNPGTIGRLTVNKEVTMHVRGIEALVD